MDGRPDELKAKKKAALSKGQLPAIQGSDSSIGVEFS